MREFKFFRTVLVATIFFAGYGHGMVVDLYLNKDKFGEYYKMEINEKGCTNVPLNWENQAESLDTHGSCIKFYDLPYCRGKYVAMQPYHGTFQDNLQLLAFNKLISSASPCGPKVPNGRYYLQNGDDGSVLTIDTKNGTVIATTKPFKPYITKGQQFDIDRIAVADYEMVPRVHQTLNPITYDMSVSTRAHPVRRTWKIESVYRGRYIIKNEWTNKCLYKADSGRVEEHDCLVWSPNQEWMFRKIKVKPFFPDKKEITKRPINPSATFPFDPLVHDFVVPNTQAILSNPDDPLNTKAQQRFPPPPPGAFPPPPPPKGSKKPGTITRLPPPPPPPFRQNFTQPFNPNERFPPVQPYPIYSSFGPNKRPLSNRPPVPIVRHPGLYPFPPAPVVTKPKTAGKKRPPVPPKGVTDQKGTGTKQGDQTSQESEQASSQESDSREDDVEVSRESQQQLDSPEDEIKASRESQQQYNSRESEQQRSRESEEKYNDAENDQDQSYEGRYSREQEGSISQESVEGDVKKVEYGPKDTPYYFKDHTYSKFGDRTNKKKTKYSDFRLFF